jgi:hypothetical protein
VLKIQEGSLGLPRLYKKPLTPSFLTFHYCTVMLLFSHHPILSLSLLLSRFFIGVALEELVAISCYNFFHLDNKRECFGGFKDLEICLGSLHAYEVKSFGFKYLCDYR